MPGTIIALTSITLNTGASLSGRAIARNGAVTLDSNNAGGCAPGGISVVPTLDFVGLTVLVVLLAVAGLFVMNRSSG